MKMTLPGRLGNPDWTLLDDPRLDARIRSVLEQVEEVPIGVEPPAAGSPPAESIAYCATYEEAVAGGLSQLFEQTMPDFAGIETSTEVIEGVDGNAINLYLHRPVDQEGPVPCILHTHGGGMVMLTAANGMYVRWRQELAATGLMVVGVEFRNGAGVLGDHPFPSGLNDCASAMRWVYANKSALNISKIVVSGESGGGNLALATALKAKREGWIQQIDGVYALCPFISGAYVEPPANLLSLVENEGYGAERSLFSAMVTAYDPVGEQQDNPLAWPFKASVEDLRGLPPHFISVNELDPLRDEGLEYYRNLTKAGVAAVGRVVAGTSHGAELVYPDVVPDVVAETFRSIHGFATAL